jgi:hypothetical protein
MSAPHSTTTTIDTTEGWTFTNNDDNADTEFPTTTNIDDGWGEAPAATTTDGWGATPAAPSPPLSAVRQPRTNNHDSLHWTACYDDYCSTHRQMKDNNYYPRRANGRHRRNHQQCPCENAHPFELAEVIRNRHLNPRRACAAWRKGKRVCPRCRFLVNMNGHEDRCQTTTEQRTPLEEIQPPQEDQENEAPAATPPPASQETQNADDIEALRGIIVMIYQDTLRNAHRHRMQAANTARVHEELHQNHHAQMEQVTTLLQGVMNEQERINHHYRQTATINNHMARIHRPPFRRVRPAHRDLAGASVWTGGVLSRIWYDRLLGAATGVVLTLAALWLALVPAAAAAILFRA